MNQETVGAFDFGLQVGIEMPSKDLPFTIRALTDIDIKEWGTMYKDQLNRALLIYGALLFREFKINGAQHFNELFSILSGEPMEYRNRTSPRSQVYHKVYTSTNHPKDQFIHMHTENSYSSTYNRIIAFYCLVPPEKGGETPIADERKLLKYLKEATVQKFMAGGILYIRNSTPGIGLDWRTIYQTDDREQVNQYLSENKIEYEWLNGDHLRVRWVLPAVQKHPVTGEEMWFNHMYFGLKSHYDPTILEYFSEEDLPFSTYYGDGSEIEESVVREFKDFYRDNAIVFKWKKDDLLLLDNMMFSHGRNPYEGDRSILTAMAQPFSFSK